MQQFKTFVAEAQAIDNAKAKLKKMKKGTEVSFTDHKTGQKVTGQYQGLKRMGARSYAHVETGKSAHRVPVHHIHQANEAVVNELDKKTLGSYINKAHRNYDKQRTKQGAAYDKDDNSEIGHEYGRKADQRTKGIKMAVNKLTK